MVMRQFKSALGIAVLLGCSSVAAAEPRMPLEALVAKKAGIIDLLHHKASRALVTVAQDAAFESYFLAGDQSHRHAAKSRIEAITLEVESRFRVAEMCLIGLDGAEITRIVGRKIAHDLSLDEASSIFFAPGLATPHRRVFIAPIYLSADVHRMVIAYVTPVLADKGTKAILHYEHDLDAYRDALMRADDLEGRILIGVTADGSIIFDSRHRISYAARKGESPSPPRFASVVPKNATLGALLSAIGGDGERGAGQMHFEGQQVAVAYARVADWTLLLLAQAGS
jgi:hypothetical protein